MKYYTSYVNNFAVAMNMLERSIQKKSNFVEFLKQKYVISKTSLSLQGLLLKPIQRFPQYILFLTVSLLVGRLFVCRKERRRSGEERIAERKLGKEEGGQGS